MFNCVREGVPVVYIQSNNCDCGSHNNQQQYFKVVTPITTLDRMDGKKKKESQYSWLELLGGGGGKLKMHTAYVCVWLDVKRTIWHLLNQCFGFI